MSSVDTFSQLVVARDRSGNFLELLRNDLEVACPAFDAERGCMVELHVFHSDEGSAGPEPEVFARQARAAVDIRHPNAAAVFAFGEEEGACFYVSESTDGEVLEEYLDRCAPLPESIALQLVRDAARGLTACAVALPVLAGMDLFQSRVRLNGRTSNMLALKVGGYGFGSRRAETLPAAGVHRYYIRSLVEILLWAVTGRQIRSDALAELTRDESIALSEPLLALLEALVGSRPAVRTLEGATAVLQQALDAAGDDAGGNTPDRLPSGLELLPEPLLPRLPLEAYFVTRSDLVAYLGDDYPLHGDPFDARTPLRQLTSDTAQGQKGVLHLLPTDAILPQAVLDSLQAALGKGTALDQPNLIRLLAYWPTENAGFFIEEEAGHLTLEEAVAWRGAFSPEETLLVLRQIDAAGTQAAACGLRIDPRGAGQVLIHFLDATVSRDPAMASRLAAQPLKDWPPFRVKVRAYPTFLSLLRCPPALARPHWKSSSREAAVFAWWAQRMLQLDSPSSAGSAVPPRLAAMVNDVAAGRAGAMIHSASEFLQAFLALMEAPAVASAIHPPPRLTLPKNTRRPESLAADPSRIDFLSGRHPRGARQSRAANSASAASAATAATAATAGRGVLETGDDVEEGEDEEQDEEDYAAPGLAEVLFQQNARGKTAHVMPDHRGGHPEDGNQQPGGSIWLVLMVVVIALLLAAIFAQLSGQAFWLRQ